MEENLSELIKTDNATIGTFGTNQKPKPIKSKIIKPKPVFGTKEWADRSENCLNGCSHDCKYCYAKSTVLRFRRNAPQNWQNEILKPDILKKEFRKFKGKIMFPSAHDITPAHLDDCMTYLKHMLKPGNQVTIVTKPHLDCVKAICEEFGWYKNKILFRFTIGSSDSTTLKVWEPNAPDFAERFESLKYAYEMGYQTSVSCETMLDDNIGDVINQVSPFVIDSSWLGKMNHLRGRLKHNEETDPVTIQEAEQLMECQADEKIKQLYSRYKDNPLIKWKESIKKVVGLEVLTEAGMDV